MKFWEVGFDMDEFTMFCLAETEEEAKTRFISWVGEDLDHVEEPGWEERVWAQDQTNRWMAADNTERCAWRATKYEVREANCL